MVDRLCVVLQYVAKMRHEHQVHQFWLVNTSIALHWFENLGSSGPHLKHDHAILYFQTHLLMSANILDYKLGELWNYVH